MRIKATKKTITKHTSLFRYADKEITFSYWSNATEGSAPDTIIFLGAGAVGIVPYLVSKNAGPGTVVIQGLPYWHAHPSAIDLIDFSRDYFTAAYRAALHTFNLASANILAESQAAPAAVLLTLAVPEKVRNIALIRPMGFTVDTYGDSPESRIKAFQKRVLRTYLQFPQSVLSDPRNAITLLTVARTMLSEPDLTSFKKKYAAGVSYDLIQGAKQALRIQQEKGHSFSILLGEKDRLFPATDIKAALAANDIKVLDVVTLHGDSHSSLAVHASAPILRLALQKVRKLPGDSRALA